MIDPLILLLCHCGGSSIIASAFLQPQPILSRRFHDGRSSTTTTYHGRKKRTIRTNDALLSTKRFASTTKTFDTFDYNAHWYPVIWSQDVPINQPIRVTLFDVDYVLAKTNCRSSKHNNDDNNKEEEETFYAMIDKCPHKKVALSEGRITDCGTKQYFQCSYHGWTFDGKTGECMEIPQTVIAKENNKLSSSSNNTRDGTNETTQRRRMTRREDATAIAVQVVQGMVFIQPNHTPLEALVAMQNKSLLPPPRIPEIDMDGYKVTCAIRDFPIDWTVLMENIMDPDHGYFAHSSSGTAKGFDWYSADGVENVVTVDEDFSDNGGWKITSSVNAVEKLIAYNNNVRSTAADDEVVAKKDIKHEPAEQPSKIATTTFVAPSLIYLGRRTNSTSPSAFVTGFWICPVGTGRSRFMSAAIGKTPFSVPRWLVHMNLNNFLDQDTFLLCGQHREVLKREAEGYADMGYDGNDEEKTNDVRKNTYVYRSPSERMAVRIGQFFDATLARVPNRRAGVMNWYKKNVYNHNLFDWPSREKVLDRYEQHTKICPDSMDVVKRCNKVMKSSKFVGFVWIVVKVLTRSKTLAMQQQLLSMDFPKQGVPFIAAIRQLFSQSASLVCVLFNRIVEYLLRDKSFYVALTVTLLSYSLASRIKREFYFKMDEELHRKDIKYIANNWKDL